MAYSKPSFLKHIEALQGAGTFSAIWKLTGRVDLNRLGRHFKMVIRRSYPDATYHFMWFRTEEGIIVCYSGNIFLLDAVDDFMQRMIKTGATGDAQELMSGNNQNLFADVLQKNLFKFTPLPLKRSFGGSHLGK